MHNEKGYYSILKEGFGSNSLQKPLNIYNLEGDLIKNLDKFQQKYARFLQCTASAPGVANSVSPICDPTNDGINSLDTAYQNVMYSFKALDNGLKKIDPASSSDLTNEEYEQSKRDTNSTYQEILTLRKNLDTKLATLYNEKKNGSESSAAQLDSSIYANTLWTILATCLLYYIIVEM